MKSLKKFRIVKETYHEKCKVRSENFIIQYQKKFLWWNRWITIKETNCGLSDCFESPMIFSSEGEAVIAIKRLQMGSIIPDGWKSEVTTILDFSSNQL